MASPPRLIFVNLPVKDLQASVEFYRSLGFEFDEKFTDDEGACMIVSQQAFVMLLAESKFAAFTTKPVADATAATETLLGVSAESREEVDSLADAAIDNGATAGPVEDYGYMYGRSYHDLDGHLWSVIWMDPVAIEQGPAELAQSA
jgi:predicted lactoylglutathione lyase